MKPRQTFDYGSEDIDSEEAEKEVIKKHIKNTRGWILLGSMYEDNCYLIWEGTEREMKDLLVEIQTDGSQNEHTALRLFHDGKEFHYKLKVV